MDYLLFLLFLQWYNQHMALILMDRNSWVEEMTVRKGGEIELEQKTDV